MNRIVVLAVLSAAAAAAQQANSVHERAAEMQRRTVLVMPSAEYVQAAFGRSALATMERRYPTVTDPTVIGYMNDLARQIADVRLTLVVFDSEEVRAGAFPGDYVYVTSGLIERMADEAELAGVLAHQIAHLAGSTRTLRPVNSSELRIPLFFAGGSDGVCSRFGGELLVPRALQTVARDREQEAEQGAAEYLKNMPPLSDSTKFDEVQRLCTPAPKEFKRPSLRRPNG